MYIGTKAPQEWCDRCWAAWDACMHSWPSPDPDGCSTLFTIMNCTQCVFKMEVYNVPTRHLSLSPSLKDRQCLLRRVYMDTLTMFTPFFSISVANPPSIVTTGWWAQMEDQRRTGASAARCARPMETCKARLQNITCASDG